MYKQFDLIPNDGRKSFYHKAIVTEANGAAVLRSYNTDVCEIDAAGVFHRYWSGYSATWRGRGLTCCTNTKTLQHKAISKRRYKTMILARINDEPRLFDTWDELGEATFCPGNAVEIITDFHLHGKTYAERKEAAREIAIDFSHNFPVDCDMSDVLLLYEIFEKWGRRYGLLEEFRENAVC